MYSPILQQNISIIGYHDKDKNQYGVLKQENLPIFTSEKFSVFLATRDILYQITTNDIKILLENKKIISAIEDLGLRIAYILTTPGILISVAYILKSFGAFTHAQFVETFLSGKLVNWLFWVALLGLLLIWYLYFKYKVHKIELPITPPISQKEIDMIITNGFPFDRYILKNSIDYISENLLNILVSIYDKDECSTYRIFEQLIKDPQVQEICRISGFDLSQLKENFNTHNINKKSLPSYEVSGLRNLLIYALREALLTKSRKIDTIHMFLSFLETFPVLTTYVHKHDYEITYLRAGIIYSRYYIESSNKLTQIFDIKRKYIKTGGIGIPLVYNIPKTLQNFVEIPRPNPTSHPTTGLYNSNLLRYIPQFITNEQSIKKGLVIITPKQTSPKYLREIVYAKIERNLPNYHTISINLFELIKCLEEDKKISEKITTLETFLLRSKNIKQPVAYLTDIDLALQSDHFSDIFGKIVTLLFKNHIPILLDVKYKNYTTFFYTNTIIQELFEKYESINISVQETVEYTLSQLPTIEKKYKVRIQIPAVLTSLEVYQQSNHIQNLPGDIIDIINETAKWLNSHSQQNVVQPEHIAKVFSIKYNIPVEKVNLQANLQDLSIEKGLQNKIVGQDHIIKELTEILANKVTRQNPISILLAGATGTGKTYIAQQIAQILYPNLKPNKLIVNITEDSTITSILHSYVNDYTIYKSSNTLIDFVKNNKEGVIIFENIDKANTAILDIIFQILSKGFIYDDNNEELSFANKIIICTTQITGDSKNIQNQTLATEQHQHLILALRKQIPTTIINSFDKILLLRPYSKQELQKIAENILMEINTKLKDLHISINWTKEDTQNIIRMLPATQLNALQLRSIIYKQIFEPITKKVNKDNTNPIKINIKNLITT